MGWWQVGGPQTMLLNGLDQFVLSDAITESALTRFNQPPPGRVLKIYPPFAPPLCIVGW